MSCSYILKENLMQRNAANLAFSLSNLKTDIYLYKKGLNRRVNGKSILGILSGHFIQGEIIKILINSPEQLSRVKEIFNNYGDEV